VRGRLRGFGAEGSGGSEALRASDVLSDEPRSLTKRVVALDVVVLTEGVMVMDEFREG